MMKTYARSVIFCACALLAGAARAQEAVATSNSTLTGAVLPRGAVRVSEASVPAGITSVLAKFAAAGEGRLRQGDTEVLAWAGGGYRKSDAPGLMRQVESTLRAGGWTYEVAGSEGQLVVFNLVRETPARRGIAGFFVATDDALVLAWTELLPVSAATPAAQNSYGNAVNDARRPANPPAAAGAVPRELVGRWDTGGVSLLQYRDTVTGSTTPGRGNHFSYHFKPDGSFQAVGLLQSNVYNCTTTLFNEKAGRAEFSGQTVTLVLSKNFWRQTNNCAPSSNSERNYTLGRETYRWRTKQDEYGKQYICLANDKGETCYRRAQE
jgi:hypothetical protein